jgi:hypothetical protein
VKRFFTILLLTMVAMGVNAETDAVLHPKVIVQSIEVIKQAERYGDEVYLVVTEFNSRNENKQYTIPRYPITWPSRALDKVHDLKIWSGDLEEGEEVHLMLELVEHDAPPFNADDSIGSADLTLKNHKGTLKVEWDSHYGMIEHEKKQDDGKTSYDYKFTGESGEYRVKFIMG